MRQYTILFTLLAVGVLLAGCDNNVAKCKRYVGDYSDRGQLLSIKYNDTIFTLEEAGHVVDCTCNDKGQLEMAGAGRTVTILLSDSAGHKRFCFDADTLREDCIYEMKK